MHSRLIHLIQNGDRDAMARLIELDQTPLHHFMVRRLEHAEDAADATQEAFRRVLVSLPRLRDPAAYRGWLYGIALNVAQDVIRSRQSERNAVRKMTQSGSPSRAEVMTDTQSEDLREKVRAAVNNLDDELRTTIVLRYEQGLSYEEIAGAMQTPAGTVAKRLHTAHQRLLQMLTVAGATVVLASLTEALAATAISPIPGGVAEALRRAALEAPLPYSALPLSLGTKGGVFLVALVLIGLGGGLVYWRGRVPQPLETISARVPIPKKSDGIPPASRGQNPPSESGEAGAASPSSSAVPDTVASLKGFVRDLESQLPIPGALVWLSDPHLSPPPRFSSVTGSDGSFLIEAPAGLYSIDVLAPGYVRYNFERILQIHRLELVKDKAASDVVGSLLEVRLLAGQPVSRTIDLLRSGEIRGLVVDPKGNSVPDAEVVLEMQDFKFSSGPQESQLSMSYEPDGETNKYVTDFRGAFQIAHLHPEGACALRVSHKGFAPLRQTISLSRPGVETRLVLQDGLMLGGRVLNDRGEAVENACLLLGVSGSNRMMAFCGRSTLAGKYLLTDQLPETRFVAAYAPGYGPALARIDPDPSQVFLVLPEANHHVSGVIVDELGQPLEGVSAYVHHYDVGAESDQARIVFVDERGSGGTVDEPGRPSGFLPQSCRPPQSKSEEDGRFELDKIALASSLNAGLQFEKTGYEMVERTVSDSSFMEIRMRRKAQK